MDRRGFLEAVGAVGTSAALARDASGTEKPHARRLRLDLHTHYYPESYFQKIRDTPGEFAFDRDPAGRTIIKYRGARFFGIQPPMTDPLKRLADMDRVGIDVETYLKRLYYDTVTFSATNLTLARDLVGTDHMVMGSDYPHLLGSIDKAVSSIEGLGIPEAEKDRVFSGTALKILNNVQAT